MTRPDCEELRRVVQRLPNGELRAERGEPEAESGERHAEASAETL